MDVQSGTEDVCVTGRPGRTGPGSPEDELTRSSGRVMLVSIL